MAASEAMSKIEQEMSGLTDFSEDDLKSNEEDLVDKGTEIKKTTLRDDVIVSLKRLQMPIHRLYLSATAKKLPQI